MEDRHRPIVRAAKEPAAADCYLRPVVQKGAMGLFKKPRITELLPVVSPSQRANVDIVFVHGLNGDAFETWAMREANSWPTWIKEAHPTANIWSLSYRVRSSRWTGGAMPLTDRSVNVLATLDGELTNLPIVFMCHSYGGLLVKQMLRSAYEVAPEYSKIAKRVSGIVFFSTPHNGSSIAAYVDALGGLLRTSSAVTELRHNAALLRDLSLWFRNIAADNRWLVRAYFETLNTLGLRIVDESSSDPQMRDVTPVGVDADHFEVCRPPKPDLRVKQTLSLIEKVIACAPLPDEHARSPLAQVLVAPNDELPYVEARLKAALAKSPGDGNVRMALAHIESIRSVKVLTNRRPLYVQHQRSYSGVTIPILLVVLILSVVFGYDSLRESISAITALITSLF